MKTTQLKIDGRTFALLFNMQAVKTMEETIPDFDLSKITDHMKTPEGMIDMIMIFAQEGELEEGRTLDVDRTWMRRHLKPAPGMIARVQMTILEAISEGLRMETETDEEAEHDEVLEEIKKKETTGV